MNEREALEKISKVAQCENITFKCPCKEWADECPKYIATQALKELDT